MKNTVMAILLLMAVACLLSLGPPGLLAQEGEEAIMDTAQEETAAPEDKAAGQGNVTMDFKDADVHNVLRILSMKSGINIVAGNGVSGPVTIRLTNVPWEQALDVILKTYGYGHERSDNIIRVMLLEDFTEQERLRRELEVQQDLLTEVYTLKYLDANDAKKTLEPLITPGRGTVTVLEARGQKGWKFGSAEGALEKKERSGEDARSKTLIISDIAPKLEKLRKIIAQIDIMPKQVLIETRIMEVSRDLLKDVGVDWGTGPGGSGTSTVTGLGLQRSNKGDVSRLGGNVLGSQVEPSGFGPKATGISGTEPYNMGLNLLYQKLTGAQFEILLHELEEDVGTNTLSAPRIVTLDNQEATIMVGSKIPITKATVDEDTGAIIGASLEFYENVGIQMNVVPQVSANNSINMIVHPSVSSVESNVTVKNSGGFTIATYPQIAIREAETQILINSGETVIIGGLLKDVQSKGTFKVPILGDLPIIGRLFQRNTTDVEKIDLLIFITARVLDPDEKVGVKYTKPMVEIGSEALRLHETLVKSQKEKVIIKRSD